MLTVPGFIFKMNIDISNVKLWRCSATLKLSSVHMSGRYVSRRMCYYPSVLSSDGFKTLYRPTYDAKYRLAYASSLD